MTKRSTRFWVTWGRPTLTLFIVVCIALMLGADTVASRSHGWVSALGHVASFLIFVGAMFVVLTWSRHYRETHGRQHRR